MCLEKVRRSFPLCFTDSRLVVVINQFASSRNFRIDSLRGWGCLAILILHGFSGYFHQHASPFWDSFLTELGNNIVSLFFCVSGYLIYQSLDTVAKTSKRPLATFYIRRAFRILPIWWILSTIMYLGGFFEFPIYLSQIFFYFGFFSYIPTYLPITPSWSLFVEENFYLFFPFLHRRIHQTRSVVVLLIGTVIVSVVWRSMAASWGVPTNNYFIGRSLFSKLPFFIFGVFILHMERFLKTTVIKSTFQRKLLLSFLGLVSLYYLASEDYRYCLFAVPLFTYVCMSPNNLFSCTEHISFLKYAGQRCYAIYIFHDPIMQIVKPATKIIDKVVSPTDGPFLWFSIYTVLILTLTLIISALSYRFIERPLIRYSYLITNRFKKI